MVCNYAKDCPHPKYDRENCPHVKPHYEITTCGVNKFGRGVGHGGCAETCCTGVLANQRRSKKETE
jgi:hypothetical protein